MRCYGICKKESSNILEILNTETILKFERTIHTYNDENHKLQLNRNQKLIKPGLFKIITKDHNIKKEEPFKF